MSFRALETLKQVDLIAAEDTRHTRPLLEHFAITKPTLSFHQHNEDKTSQMLLEKLLKGESIALVSDAGTPLISDPGLPLVALAQKHKIRVSPIPGPCALIAALSASGLPLNRFTFEGFLPRTSSARKDFFQQKRQDTSTWAFYESSHRILASLEDFSLIFPSDHTIVIARELTKLFETIISGSLEEILKHVNEDENMRKGEFVVIVSGTPEEDIDRLTVEQERILGLLVKECSIKKAAQLASDITGQRKNLFYQTALNWQKTENY